MSDEHWIDADEPSRYLPDMPLAVLANLLRAIADEIEYRSERNLPPRVLEASEPPDFRVPDDDFGN